jgi:SAM-dependent methyltransferase
MTPRTITYDLNREERARGDWYLHARDEFVSELVRGVIAEIGTGREKVLDAGCGVGRVAEALSTGGLDVTGMEIDEGALSAGRGRQKLYKPVRASIVAIPFRDNSFDVCVCSEVLEHVADDLDALRELLRVSRHAVVLTVPGHNYLWTSSDDILLHRRRYGRRDIVRLLGSANCNPRAVEINPYGFLPGICVLLYKLVLGSSRFRKTQNARSPALPLAARFSLPRWANAVLASLFRIELSISKGGWLPWGHGWWLILRKGY